MCKLLKKSLMLSNRYMVHWLFQPFTIFATFCRVGMKLTCYFHNLPKEMFLCGFVSYEDVKVIKCWLWHNIKVCIGKKIAQSFPLVYFMESNNNLATGQALQFIYSEKTTKFKKISLLVLTILSNVRTKLEILWPSQKT